MKRQTNKEQMYVINQPKHLTSTIIVVGDEFPLREEVHNDIEKLCEISDVLFMFAPSRFTHQEDINFDKFASLYRSCAWVESGASLGRTLMYMVDYDREIFETHRSTLILNSWDLGDIDTDKIMSLVSSSISKPIVKIERLKSDEFYEIYKEEEYSNPILNYLKPRTDVLEKAFCSYKAISDLVFLRSNTIDTILSFYDNREDDFPKKYVKSFTGDDIKYLLGSLIKYLGLDYFDANYKNIKL